MRRRLTCAPSTAAGRPTRPRVSFDSSNQYVSFGNADAITKFGTDSFTVEGWFRPDLESSATPDYNVLFHIGRSGGPTPAGCRAWSDPAD